MTLPVRLPTPRSLRDGVRDYVGYMRPFLARVRPKTLLPAMAALKTIEWAVYRWYEPPPNRRGALAEPVRELIYKITSNCTDRCVKCGIWRSHDGERVRVEWVEDCLRALAPRLGGFTVTGGEPLLFKAEVLRLAHVARRLRVAMNVVTNGVLVDPEFLEAYGALGHTLVISMDTLDALRWREFRGRDHSQRVVANVRRAAAALGSKIHIQSVLAAETRADVPAVAAFCAELGIEHRVQPWADFGGGWGPAPASHDATEARTGCDAWRNVCILPNGNLVRCFDHERLPIAREPLGNIAREGVTAILARERTERVTVAMKACRFPCRHLACNRAA